MSLHALLSPLQTPKLTFSNSSPPPPPLHYHSSFKFPSKFRSFSLHNDTVFEEDPLVIGDCLVFEEGVFEDPYEPQHQHDVALVTPSNTNNTRRTKSKTLEIETDNLVPEKWRQVQAEINITKKDRRKIAQELEFNSRVERKRRGLAPIRRLDLDEFTAFKEAKLRQLKPLVLDNPTEFSSNEKEEEEEGREIERSSSSSSDERVKGKNPRWAVYGRGFDDVNEFFNSPNYDPAQKNAEGPRKLFTKEEKVLLNKRIPDLGAATSRKWIPLHTLAASGEFYLLNALLKHNVDINSVDEGGLTTLHKAIMGKKQAITSYLLRESANPFVRDADGATLMHYAVQRASIPAIKLLLLYNVDINLQDNDGWTPLHLAVQTRRTDIVKLLLIKGADKTLRNQDGLTPLDLCLYSGQDTRTYELIKLLKQLPKKSTALAKYRSFRVSAT